MRDANRYTEGIRHADGQLTICLSAPNEDALLAQLRELPGSVSSMSSVAFYSDHCLVALTYKPRGATAGCPQTDQEGSDHDR